MTETPSSSLPSVEPPTSPSPTSPPGSSPTAEEAPPASGLLGAFDELLRHPDRFVRSASPEMLRLVLVGAVLCSLAYGFAAGAFSGRLVLLTAALKAPLIIFGSLALCLPSLYVFGSLAGVDISRRRFSTSVVGLSGLLGLLLVAVLPVVWLFSVSSRSLTFVVFIHLLLWAVALLYGHRFIRRALGGGGSLTLWFFLFFIVTLQVTTQLRPVLTPGHHIFESGKKSFLEHVVDNFAYGSR